MHEMDEILFRTVNGKVMAAINTAIQFTVEELDLGRFGLHQFDDHHSSPTVPARKMGP